MSVYEFPGNGYNNKDGMYTVPEHQDGIAAKEYVENNGVWIPKPAEYKEIRRVDFHSNGHLYRLEVEETVEEIMSILGTSTEDWFKFTDCDFGYPMYQHRSGSYTIIEGFKDMEAVRQQMEAAELSKKIQGQQLTQAKLSTLRGKNHR